MTVDSYDTLTSIQLAIIISKGFFFFIYTFQVVSVKKFICTSVGNLHYTALVGIIYASVPGLTLPPSTAPEEAAPSASAPEVTHCSTESSQEARLRLWISFWRFQHSFHLQNLTLTILTPVQLQYVFLKCT